MTPKPLQGRLAMAAVTTAILTWPQDASAQTNAQPPDPASPPPGLVAVDPNPWSTDVSPSLGNVRLRFDQPMRPGFTDWLGRRSLMPAEFQLEDQISTDLMTQWLDVDLEPGRVYVFALNERGRRGVGFQNQRGISMRPHFIVFKTRGDILDENAPPEFSSSLPEHNNLQVDPASHDGIAVTFDRPMITDDHGFIITLNGKPVPLDDAEYEWNDDATTCLLKLALKPLARYRVTLNSIHNIGFRAANRVPLWPAQLEFQTVEPSVAPDPAVADTNSPPEIVLTEPAMWSEDVQPGPKRILLSFDQPMRRGFTDWLGRNQRGPFNEQEIEAPEGSSDDGRTVWLDVILEPATLYVFPLNERGRRGVGFQNKRGLAMEPRFLVFRTAGPVAEEDISPVIESSNPPDGAAGLEPGKIGAATIIFDRPMNRETHGATLVADGSEVELGEDDWSWSADGFAFSIRIDWQPDTAYKIVLNSSETIGFATPEGVPLWATEIRFSTGTVAPVGED